MSGRARVVLTSAACNIKGAPVLLRDLQFVGVGWGISGDFVDCYPHVPHICGDFVDIYPHFVNDSSILLNIFKNMLLIICHY